MIRQVWPPPRAPKPPRRWRAVLLEVVAAALAIAAFGAFVYVIALICIGARR